MELIAKGNPNVPAQQSKGSRRGPSVILTSSRKEQAAKRKAEIRAKGRAEDDEKTQQALRLWSQLCWQKLMQAFKEWRVEVSSGPSRGHLEPSDADEADVDLGDSRDGEDEDSLADESEDPPEDDGGLESEDDRRTAKLVSLLVYDIFSHSLRTREKNRTRTKWHSQAVMNAEFIDLATVQRRVSMTFLHGFITRQKKTRKCCEHYGDNRGSSNAWTNYGGREKNLF
jgi:hypothetical protein